MAGGCAVLGEKIAFVAESREAGRERRYDQSPALLAQLVEHLHSKWEKHGAPGSKMGQHGRLGRGRRSFEGVMGQCVLTQP